MLTIDDINSIFKKYEGGFWYEIDLNGYEIGSGKTYKKDFWSLFMPDHGQPELTINLSAWKKLFYFKNSNGEFINCYISRYSNNTFDLALNGHTDVIFGMYISNHENSRNKNYFTNGMFVPLSNLTVSVVNGEYEDKIYVHYIGFWSLDSYTIDGQPVPTEEDENGTFVRLLSPIDCNLGVITQYGSKFDMYRVIFKEFKTLPILSIPTVYKGNTQTIQLLDDTDEITEFQAYYKGELLNDNKITLPYDVEDYIDITVDILDNRYPNSTLKLKAPTMMYTANSQSDVETAISQGITTLQVGDTETEVSLNGIELSNITLVNSNIQLTNSTLNNCTILNSQYTDNGANTITNTIIRNTDYTSTSKSVYEDTSFYNSHIQDSELQITGTIYECELTNSLIISDGTININNNTFTGIGSKTYFPSHLYLTGDYIVSGNTFNLTGTFTELQFNMCLIKATNDFNISEFINKNSFNLNITYGEENPSTLYYNIVDDDKIRARRLS